MHKSVFILGAVAVAAIGSVGAATAADLPMKAPYLKAPVAMVYDWTGFYIGVNAGVGIGRDYTRLAIPAFPGGPTAEASYLSPTGGVGGGQIGYNWQTGPLFLGSPMIFGVEADLQGTGLSDHRTCLLGCMPAQNSMFSQKLDWFGTVRGRIGLTEGPVMTYLTAGYAYGSVKTTLTETIGTTGAFSSNQNHGGWTWGSGIEASLGGNWSGKIEYLWLTLGNRLNAFTLNTFPQAMSTDIREQIFRVGLNYRIGGNSVYVLPPAANWAGFYLGGNIGSGTGRDRSALNVGGVGGTTELFNLSPDGINGGIQAGYNWQAANVVFGLEADIQGSSQRDNRACVQFCAVVVSATRSAGLYSMPPAVTHIAASKRRSSLILASARLRYRSRKPRAAGPSAEASRPPLPSWLPCWATTGPRRPSISMSTLLRRQMLSRFLAPWPPSSRRSPRLAFRSTSSAPA